MIPTSGARLVIAEICLLGLSLVVALGFTRLFSTGGWQSSLVAATVAAHGCGAVMRRLHSPISLQVVSVVITTGLIMAWTQASDTLRYLLPTAETLEALRAAFDQALTLYPEARAPTEPVSGFILAAMVGLVIAATMADIAAFRLGSEIQAILPAFTLFVFCSLLGSGQHQIRFAIAFTLVALTFVLVMRSFGSRFSSTWLPNDAQRGPKAMMRTGGGLAVVVVALAAVVTPSLPGSGSEAMWTWRGSDGPGVRVVLSPLIDIRSRMVDQPSVVAFTVRAPEPSYWRMMALDSFDGNTFGMSGNYRPVDNRLVGGTGGGRLVEQEIRIDALASPYLPAAFTPTHIDTGGEPVRWDERSSTLLMERDSPPRGFTYQVESRLGSFEPDVLRAATGPVLPNIRDRYLDVPELDPAVVELAHSIVEGAASPYDQALALQNHLRRFEYSLNVPQGHSDSALARFLLVDQAGYCEQFSAAFAALARVVGLPSRVAVGFTVGEASTTRPGTYVVRGEHAHAWPEVWFSGVGWVPFEPTPGRGNPQSEAHTGVEPQQAGPTTTTTTSTTTPGDRPSTTFDPSMLPVFPEAPAGGATGSSSGPSIPYPLKVVLAVTLVVGLWAAVVSGSVWLRRRIRWQRAKGRPREVVLTTWAQVVESARSLRLVPHRSETHREFARRILGAIDHPVPGELVRLAELASAARFASPADDSSDLAMASIDVERVVDAGAMTEAALRSARSGSQRLADLIDVRRIWNQGPRTGSRRLATVVVGRLDSR